MKTSFGMGKVVGIVLTSAAVVAAPARVAAQSRSTPAAASASTSQPTTNELQSPFVGSWSYRSFVSDPNLATPPNNLLFGSGTMTLAVPSPDRLSGTLGGDGWQLTLKGGVTNGNPATIRFQGTGTIDKEEWIYDYLGYLVPVWPDGVNQRPAIVGTIIRTKPHSDGQGGISPAGVVAQWIAVRQDLPLVTPGAKSGQVAGPRGPAPVASSGAATSPQDAAATTRQLREMYIRQDKIERQREATRRSRQSESGGAATRNDEPGGAAANVNDYRLDFHAVPSLHPVTYTSANGKLELILNLDYGVYAIGRDQVRLRTYNNGLVGPALRIKAGDTLFITLVNDLPSTPNPPPGHGANGHHEWNTTNLHFHGLHVAPQGPRNRPDEESDNVLLELNPSAPFDPNVSVQKYAVHIPASHPAGTFWYHAHKHGSVAAQVSSGLAGALIVDRDDAVTNLDSIPEIRAAAQEIVVLQQIPYTSNVFGTFGGIEPTSAQVINAMFGPAQWPNLGRYTLVNGLRIPTITIAPGEVRRFRFIDTGQRELIQLKIEPASDSPHPGNRPLILREIALDGLPTGTIVNRPLLELYPGYRADALVRPAADASGDYYLVDASLDERKGADGSPEPVRRIAKIVVTGRPVRMELPTKASLASQRLKDIPSGDATATRYAFYGIELPSGGGNPNFLISEENLSFPVRPVDPTNANSYSPTRARHLPLNHTERWLIGSRNGLNPQNNQPLNVTHPFHIHVNPFLITRVSRVENGNMVDVTAEEIGGPTWRDTLAMKQGYLYEFLTRYENFAGSFVDHCHILDHEDNGMMELVTIDEPGVASKSDVRGNRIDSTIHEKIGKPSVLLFVRGAYCQHCRAQLTEMATHLSGKDLEVFVISASTEADLRALPPLPFTLVADPDLRMFRKYGIPEGDNKHATLAFNAAGREVFRNVGDEPFMDSGAILGSLGQVARRFEKNLK